MPAETVEELYRRIAALTDVKPGAYVLDLGAGTGALAGPILRDGYRYLGVDGSDTMLRRFQFDSADLIQGDLLHLPMRDVSVDLVLAFRVFGVVRGWRHGVRECLRVLRSGGYLVAGRVVREEESIAEFIRNERNRMLRGAGIETVRPGAGDAEIEAELANAMEATPGIEVIDFSLQATPRQLIDQNLSGWRIAALTEGLKARLQTHLSRAVEERCGDLESLIDQPAGVRVGLYRKRGSGSASRD
jgi:SAM-dependent methyltransferase